jgi:hypothetical protein
MNDSKPPAIATWLLEHAVLGREHESLIGDLLEEFGCGRSVMWYWRQVLGAILISVLTELRDEWTAAGLAVVGTLAFVAGCTTCILSDFWQRELTTAVIYWEVHIPRGQRGVGELFSSAVWFTLGVIHICVVLFLYLLLLRSFDAKKFLRALLIGLGVYALVYLGEVILLRNVPLVAHLVDYFGWNFYFYDLRWIHLFLALLASIWAGEPGWRRSVAKLTPA